MILRKLHLAPFAGITERTLEFHPKLTVVLGPNEAGKSTMVAALRLLLFTPSRLGKRQFQKEVAPFMPLGGGDTIRADLEFSPESGGGVFLLSRAWGEGARSELRLPDGNLLAGDEAVRNRLDELLVLREGTWRSMLFTDQSGVADSLGRLGSGDDPVTDLAAILRRALFETDGISLERLERAIEERHTALFRRWDRELDRPENNRGIDNPYSREVGRILGAHYDTERARRTRDAALAHERELDRMNRQLNDLVGETQQLEAFLETNRQAAEDARLRRVVELERQALEQEEDALRRVNTSWPALQQELKGLAGQRDGLVRSNEKLTAELERAGALESAQRDLEKLERAEKEHRSWHEAVRALERLPAPGKAEYDEAVGLAGELQQLAIGLRAGRITLSFTPKTSTTLTVAGDFEEPVEHRLAAGERFDLKAGGQIRVAHPDWLLAVNSGDADTGDLQQTRERLSSRLAERLEALGCSTIDELHEKRASFSAARREVESRLQRLEAVLDGETLEALRARRPAGTDPGGHRPVVDIAREQGQTAGRIRELDGEIRVKQEQLAGWQEEYGTAERLLDLLLVKREAHRAAESRLDALTPLPEGAGEAGGFVARYEQRQAEYRQGRETLNQVKMDRLEFQARGPGETLEEAEAALRIAEASQGRIDREAAAMDRIREAFDDVRSVLDAETMAPWTRELERVVPLLTGGRYQGIEGDAGGARLIDGPEIPAGRLSLGTRAGVGLAVRLSMARYFLGAADGFLILDDPLVDMDPDRQAAAAEITAEFAAERQTILFTCHPGHAERLGGHLVQLSTAGGEG